MTLKPLFSFGCMYLDILTGDEKKRIYAIINSDLSQDSFIPESKKWAYSTLDSGSSPK
tara:strand:- start:101 stop:274 length:174 start_codon:yes stop_codon:yes gene_type:complete